ncbi:MAG: hypothetical protein MUE74_09455, partial [Bacteroidales bacterium]|nr:hypothetical protein [Bacteroidales bacterium]
FTQTPQKLSYQAVLRDKDGNLLVNQLVGMRTTILQGSTIQLVVYQETYTFTATNDNGLLIVEIGSGKPTIVSGPFTSIPWSSGPFFLKTEIDPAGGTNYTITGQSQILSVPYALYAEKTGTVTETDPVWTASASSYYTKSNLRQPGEAEVLFGNISSKPATLAGYGITDAMATSHPANLITQSEITKWNTPHSGDVTGSSTLTVTGIRGRAISETAPVAGQVLSWNGSSWTPLDDGISLPFSGQTNTGTSGIDIRHNAASGVTIGGSFWNASISGTAVRGNSTASTGDTYGGSFQNASTSGKAVNGFASATTGTTFGGRFENWSSSGTAVYGTAIATSGTTYGGQFHTSSTEGIGVYGNATAESGNNCGGFFSSSSSDGIGIYGQVTKSSGNTRGVNGVSWSTSGMGVRGYAGSVTGANYGVYGLSASESGYGVTGVASATIGRSYGVYGISLSTEGMGVYGETIAESGFTYSIYGRNSSIDGIAVFGLAHNIAGINFGVYGLTNSSTGRGVMGSAVASSGVNYGVYGHTNSSEGYAGYFQGRVHIAGTLSKSGGSFKIDHPLDPKNKWLSHSFVESPDMMNIYNGTVILNNQGEALVQLPEWFEALNRDFRYQLTAIGSPGPDLYISQEIENNQFQIAGGKTGLKVSWQVTGIRKDAFAEKNRIKVEEDKNPDERGKYMHPGLFGQPEEKGVHFFRNQEINNLNK